MGRSRRARAARWKGALGVALAAIAAALLGAPSLADSQTPAADAAAVLNVRDEGRVHYVKSSGSTIIDEGRASGTVPGWVKVGFAYSGEPTVAARFTITGRYGSISAHATARLSNPSSASPSFRGTVTITGGTGRYLHAHGRGELYGVFYRRSYDLTVQAIGRLAY